MNKIRMRTSSIRQLVKRCQKATGKRCSGPEEWPELRDLDMREPSADTVALLVNMHIEPGEQKAVYIHDSNDDQVAMVGSGDYKGYSVIIPWQIGLKYVCYGSCKIAELFLKS
ncbi:hypothetical protein BDP55DRAFT_678208 [Colletotrichum godetiae]|uniref:Uncharacterized protein n=1 Tax=Colletotrichum godetiae TaxID=1209918 RepID=A0AAJ0ACB8_9PEZI|nr:uncharacterized protein BDP55DRAFT_678208 [Colletotrichum godetiae]KAK1659888.1 hypothetical protein BDP55DRAFT_678208 [Colletotrichum godetiae]